MSSIFEKIALKVISYYLDNYINPIQGSQIKLALTSGNAELNNVSIKSTALSTHHLPFTVTSGIIQSIKLHFPWHSLKKRPCVIEIDGIHIIANFSKTVKLKSEIEVKETVLKSLEEAGLDEEKVKSSFFQGTMSQIISNIIINIKNIHIRVEINTPDPNTTFAVGLICNQIECFTISENGNQTFVQPDSNISKRIKIHDFSIYADPQPEPLDLPTTQEKISEYLRMRYFEKHQYILDSFSFSSDYIITKKQLQTFSNMENLIDQICFKLTRQQMAVFGEYLFQYNLFQLRQKYSLCGRPNNYPICEDEIEEKKLSIKWWRFLHHCTIEKRFPNRINIHESIVILKTRNNYFNVWKIRQSMNMQDFKKNSNYKILKSIEDKLPLNSILLLRNYSDYRINKEKEEKLVLDKNDLDMLTSSNTLENCIDISLLIKRIKIKIYESKEDEKPILTFAAHELNSRFKQSFDKSISFSLICKSMKIYSKQKIIFQQESTNRSSIEIKYTVTPSTKEENINVIASAPFINVDLKFLYKLKLMFYDNGFKKSPSSNYFSFTQKIAEIVAEEANKYTPYMIRKGQYADLILQKKCDDFPYMKIKMKLFSPTVQIQGAKLSFKMKEINFESFPIHERFANQVDTLYSNYLLKCIDFSIGLGDYEILKPVTIDFNLDLIIVPVEWLDKFRIALNISSIAVVLVKETYREIVTGLTQLLKLSQEYEQTIQQAEKVENPSDYINNISYSNYSISSISNSNYIENLNMENLSTNFATKVSILFNNISLELVSVGRFDIINFETQVTVGSNGLGLNLRIENINCNSLENKYIFFDVNEINSEDHFLQENNAIVCQYTLFFDKAMKFNMSINSPTIIIDFGWIESTLDFFKSADIKALLMYQSQQQQQQQQQPQILNETDINIIESVMIHSIEFQLLKPTFKVILPALNKCKDDVELTLNLDYISYGQIEGQSDEKQNMLLKMPTFSFEWKKRLGATINNFSILIGDSISLFFDDLTVLDIIENKKNIEIKPLVNPFLIMKSDKDKFETTINDFNILFDVNSYMIPELFLSLLKSSIIANIVSSFIDETKISTKTEAKIEEEKSKSNSYIVNMPNANVVLVDNDVRLNSHFNCIFNISPEIKNMFFKELKVSFSEKEFNFSPIFENVTLQIGFTDNTFIFTIDKTNAYISPSDIIDSMNFFNKIMNLYSTFSHQLDYSKPIEEVEQSNESSSSSKSIKNLCISNNKIVLELCENNRISKIPYPFLRLTINSNSANVSLIKSPSFILLGFRIDILNKNTQRWDLLVEPLEIILSFTDTKHFNFAIKNNLNVVISHAILNQICQFRFERQSVKKADILPSFFVENNTREECKLVFKDPKDNISIPPQCFSALKKNEPFKFLGTVIDPMNFFSPQFIANKYSFSIFIKGKERHLSVNSPVLFKNRSNLILYYQERHSKSAVELFYQSITPLYKLSAEFGIYGKKPQKTPQAINLFRLKERKSLFIPVYVEDKTYYFFLSIKFSKKRGIVMLTLTPKYKIRNNYKLPIIFTVNETSQKIRIQGKSTQYLDHAGFDSSFTFIIEANEHVSQPTNLNLTNNCFIPVNFSENSAFSLRYDNDIISLQPPVLVKNLTDLSVTIFDFQNNPILTLPTKNSEDFIGPQDFFKENKIQLAIQIEGYEKSELFDTNIGRRKMFLKSLSNDFLIPICLLFSIGATGIIYLKIDHLIYISNESIEKLCLQPIEKQTPSANNQLEIDPGQTKPVLFGTTELNFLFNIEKVKEPIEINLKNTLKNRNKFATLIMNQFDSDQFIISVDFQTSSTLAGHIIVIKDCVFPQPLVLTNLLGEKNDSSKAEIVVNSGFNSQKIGIKPMSTSIISSRDLVGQKLKVLCYNHEFEVDLTKFTEPTKETIKIGDIDIDIYFKLVCLENGSHMIIISNEIVNKSNKFNLFSTHEISFKLSIPFISLNLIDDQMRELALIGFQNTNIECEFNKDTVEMNLQIDLFQIDDMYPDTIVPVAIFNSSPPFLSLRLIKENANMIFDLIELKLKPLTFYIDINYVAELFNFFTTIKMKKKVDVENVDIKETSSSTNKNQSSIPILIKNMFIGKVELNISASSQTGRPTFHPFPYEFIMDYIPSIANIYLGRQAFSKTDLSSDNKVIKKMLKDYYDPLLSNIKGLLAAKSIAFVFRSISNAFHKIGDTTKIDVAFNQEKGKVIQRSFQSFGKGLLNGVTGVVMKPVKGLKEDGAKGFFIGLGKGVSGIITDPVAGLIDAGAGIVDEVRNSMSESRDSMRFPRVFNNIQVQEYDRVSAVCQLQYQRHVKNYGDCFVYFVNGKDNKFVGITESFIVFLIPNNQQKKSKEYKVSNLRSISDIENVCAYDNFLIFKFIDESGYDVECQSSDIADIASKIIVSRSYYSNYMNNSASMNKIASSDFSSNEELTEVQKTIVINDGFYSLKNTNGKYVTNDKESMPLIANRGKAKSWEKFQITNNDDGTISFFSMKNKKYVTVGKNSKLYATANKIAQNEKFSVTKVKDNWYNFLSMKTRQYVSADRNKLAKLYANRSDAKGWERFELVPRD